MRITRILLKGYKRFMLSNIDTFEAEFPKKVTVICSINGSGKSSLLRELCPLPPVRTDFEKDGRKELDIEHNNHVYNLISDFGNKTSPHSFIMDGEELNIGHTTQIQSELVNKHFGITSSIYDLIYNRVQLSRTTKSERKNLFLKINPMDLSVILDAHKKTLSKIKDCKANLVLLKTKKAELESKMISDDILKNNKTTKDNLNEQVKLTQMIIFGLNQHIEHIKNIGRADYESNATIDTDAIVRSCKEIGKHVRKYTSVSRGDAFYTEKEKLNGTITSLRLQKDTLLEDISRISTEIEEFHKHLDECGNERNRHMVEQDIENIDARLNELEVVNITPIPIDEIDEHYSKILSLKKILDVFMNSGCEFKNPAIVNEKLLQFNNLKQNVVILTDKVNSLRDSISECENELSTLNDKAKVPSECNFRCGLRFVFESRKKQLTDRLSSLKNELESNNLNLNKQIESRDKMREELGPYIKYSLVSAFNNIKSILFNSKFGYSPDDDKLIELINKQPMQIIASLDEIIKLSEVYEKRRVLLEKRKLLETELSTIMKTSSVNSDFIKKELTKRENDVKVKLGKLNSVKNELLAADDKYNLYLEYSTACDKIKELQDTFSQGERALIVKSAVSYWNNVKSVYEKINLEIQEELRSLETIIREQDLLRYTRDNEIIPSIDEIEKKKGVLSKIEYALSPNTGIPHSSMVKYINTMINNVNYFISKIWSYKIQLDNISETDAIDYGFSLKIMNNTVSDISLCSDGQKEAIDFVWVLTILLQMKLLDKIPFFADEISRCMDSHHRTKTLEFINTLVDGGLVEQIFIINHFAAISDGFTDSNIVCINGENMVDLPERTNENVKITYY